jgi:hypothetical protein
MPKNETLGVNIRIPRRIIQTLRNGTVISTTASNSASRTKGFVGVQLPTHKSLIKQVLPATTPMSANDFIVKSKSYHVSTAYTGSSTNPLDVVAEVIEGVRGNGYGSSYIPSTPPAFSGSTYNTAYNKAVSRLYDQLREFESRASVGEDLGEITQTVRQLRKPIAGIQNLLRYSIGNHVALLKKARWNNTKAIARGLGQTVVEYRYGIQPLINTIADVTVSLGNRDKSFFFYPFRAVGKASAVTEDKASNEIWGVGGSAIKMSTHTDYKVVFKGVYSAESDHDQYSYSQSLGLTWGEFIPTLYNLIPYSFLLDYVINLNEFVNVMAVPWGKVRWCNMTERATTMNSQEFWKGVCQPSYSVVSFAPGYINTSVTGVRRSDRSSSVPLPNLQVKRPNSRQLSNVAALLASNLPVVGNLTRLLLKNKRTKDLDRHFTDINRDYKLRVPYPKFTYS